MRTGKKTIVKVTAVTALVGVAVSVAVLAVLLRSKPQGSQKLKHYAQTLIARIAPAVPPIPATSSVPAGYHLTFDDEFKTLSISDTDGAGTKWYSHTVSCCMLDTTHREISAQMGGMASPEGEKPFYLRPEGLDIRMQKTNGEWYSGIIASVDHTGRGFSQQYGYFEMKAKFPAGAGTWPSFWLLNTAALSGHAYAGEIDVVESYMFAPSYDNVTLHDMSPPRRTVGYGIFKVADLTKGFHTFGMLWTPTLMTFYCDGAVVYKTPTPSIMNQPYYPIVDLGLGGGWPTGNTPQKSDLIVQYVRVYSP